MIKKRIRGMSSKLSRSVQKMWFDISGKTTVLIVMFHGTQEPPTDKFGPWKYSVSTSLFEEKIRSLLKNYEIVRLDELIEGEKGGNGNLGVITFDDGYINNLNNALPILEKYNIPAMIYISTSFINGSVPYEYLLADTIQKRNSIEITVSGKTISRTLGTPSSRKKAYQEIVGVAKNSLDARQELKEQLPEVDGETSIITAEEIKDLDTHPLITIGAHGHNHLPLASLSNSEMEQDVENCTSILEDIVGHTVSHFSYPYGSHNSAVRKAVLERGYKTAVTTDPSYNKLRNISKNKLQLSRFDASVSDII